MLPAPGAVSTGNAAAPNPGDTPATLAMTCAQNRTGSLSPGSTDTHAVRDAVSARRQSRSRQVFPQPAGALMTTSRAGRSSPRRLRRGWRTTAPGRPAGRRSFEASTSIP